MYQVAVKRDFIAQHYLIGGDWGAENQPHSHHYQIEVQLEGEILDSHGYLVDISQIENALESLIARYRDQTLNDLAEFSHLNPSLEHFARLLCEAVARQVLPRPAEHPNISALSVKLWESESAWASYRMHLRDA